MHIIWSGMRDLMLKESEFIKYNSDSDLVTFYEFLAWWFSHCSLLLDLIGLFHLSKSIKAHEMIGFLFKFKYNIDCDYRWFWKGCIYLFIELVQYVNLWMLRNVFNFLLCVYIDFAIANTKVFAPVCKHGRSMHVSPVNLTHDSSTLIRHFIHIHACMHPCIR